MAITHKHTNRMDAGYCFPYVRPVDLVILRGGPEHLNGKTVRIPTGKIRWVMQGHHYVRCRDGCLHYKGFDPEWWKPDGKGTP